VDAKVIQAGMFNTQSNEKMRKAMLESLLREDDEEEVNLIQSTEHLNTLIARDDEEFQYYQQLDEEFEKREEEDWVNSGRSGRRPSRLIQEYELPEWMKYDLDSFKEDITAIYGRGMRERREIEYDDGLSEIQFDRMLAGEDVKKKRKKKRDQEDSEDNENSDHVDSPDPSSSKKRSHHERDKSEKKEKKDKKDKEEKHAKKKKKHERRKEESEKPRSIIQGHSNRILQKMTNMKDDAGRPISVLFLKLPSKRDYPDYYQLITNPISLHQIKSRNYNTGLELRADYGLMFSNAMTYNEPLSQVYQDALTLQKKFFEIEYAKEFSEDGQPRILDSILFDESSKDAESGTENSKDNTDLQIDPTKEDSDEETSTQKMDDSADE